jgi:hypothetical protein
MKNTTATGFDGKQTEIWKMLRAKKGGIKMTVNLLNKIKNGRDFPEEWKTDIICPIYKRRGKRYEPSNYRGI